MRASRDHLLGLIQLARVTQPDERRALWRQSMATLAAAIEVQHALPLEGLDPEALAESVKSALETKLIDDVGFLSAPAANAALYELAAALPMGTERRELGRIVLKNLHEGDAHTFVALATQIALGSRRALSGAPIRARVALALDLPFGVDTRSDALALALISRRDMEREWLSAPSTGALPSRRLAARLLERAAREAGRRSAQGDDSGLRVFQTESIVAAWSRLLSDRESLVWRHVASARGLLSSAIGSYADEIERDLDPKLSPTEWRRAAASMGARLALEPLEAHARIVTLLRSELVANDRGVAAAVVLGLPRAAEVEPETVEDLLPELVRRGGLVSAEALVTLRREQEVPDFGHLAADLAQRQLEESLKSSPPDDDGKAALIEAIIAELDPETETGSLPARLHRAVLTFAETGAEDAYRAALEVLEAARGTLAMLLLSKGTDATARRHRFRALHEIDIALLEKSTVADLLALGKKEGANALSELLDSLDDWIVARESEPLGPETELAHPTLHLHRLRTLLHLVDQGAESEERAAAIRPRRMRNARVLLGRVERDAASPLRRVIGAAAARACDALLREDLCAASDILLLVAHFSPGHRAIDTFAEATMVPEVEAILRAYLGLYSAAVEGSGGPRERACLDALIGLANSLPFASSPRVEALRTSLLLLVRSLESIASATSLRAVSEGPDGTSLAPLENAVHSLALLGIGARRRLGVSGPFEPPTAGASIRLLDFSIERALKGSRDALADAIEGTREPLAAELSPFVALAVGAVLDRVRDLPIDAPRKTRTSFHSLARSDVPLPAWLPPTRVVGGFYVLRSLGTGAVGSVFVARRVESKNDANAERFALKVPEYDGSAARTLSEEEFLQLFREEAGALLALPAHQNLAKFVTFDAGARPKPILAMELVEGPSLERALQMNDLDMPRAFDILEGIADGLLAMHAAGLAHLDVKPSNVILRDPDGRGGPTDPGEPVLVDFGLAGRHLRPGCGTGEYGAPEVWGAFRHEETSALAADVYSFGCVIYEVLTGLTLFNGASELALISAHITHDGGPNAIDELEGGAPGASALAALLHQALRHHPNDRVSIAELRVGLTELRHLLGDRPWPLRMPAATRQAAGA
jgi:hypothetical protein